MTGTMKLTEKQVYALAAISMREKWAGEVAAEVGLPFNRLENVRPTLNYLVKVGLATSSRMSNRVIYAITEAGHRVLSDIPEREKF